MERSSQSAQVGNVFGPELTVESVPTPQRGFPEAVARGFHAAAQAPLLRIGALSYLVAFSFLHSRIKLVQERRPSPILPPEAGIDETRIQHVDFIAGPR